MTTQQVAESNLKSWQQALRDYNARMANGETVRADLVEDAEFEVSRLSKRVYVLQCQSGRGISFPSAQKGW